MKSLFELIRFRFDYLIEHGLVPAIAISEEQKEEVKTL